MRLHLSLGCCVAALFAGATGSVAADPRAAPLLDEAALAARVDALLSAQQKAKAVQPAPRNDDAAFIRGAYLDLTGCIPPLMDVRDFLDDPRPDKRRAWVDELLAGTKPSGKPDAFPRHFGAVVRTWVMSRSTSEVALKLNPEVEEWLVKRLKRGVTYDRLVRELLETSPLVDGRITMYGRMPNLFYRAYEYKPETLATATARLFLGVTVDCAQCHRDRSGAHWTQEQFWSLAAFYADLDLVNLKVSDRRELEVPGTKKVVRPRFLDGVEPAWGSSDPRTVLADWVTGPRNPYFARATVNRFWWYFFGTGLVDPVDAAGDHNPPSHPELLDELARQFIGHGYDQKYLIRAIALTEAYQRASTLGHRGQNDPRLFARKAVRNLSPEQLFDSIEEVTAYPGVGAGAGERDPDSGAPTLRNQFVARFAQPGGTTEASTSVLQALYLMNGPFLTDQITPERNRTLAAIIADTRGGTGRQVETLFLVALSRKPNELELKRYVEFVESSTPAAERRAALGDVLWILLNSAEFRVNH